MQAGVKIISAENPPAVLPAFFVDFFSSAWPLQIIRQLHIFYGGGGAVDKISIYIVKMNFSKILPFKEII
jgi:hypothetical protein